MPLNLPPDILNVILSFHRGICEESYYDGNPTYQLYWAYDISALRELLGMSKDKYRRVKSSFGRFLRKNRSSWPEPPYPHYNPRKWG